MEILQKLEYPAAFLAKVKQAYAKADSSRIPVPAPRPAVVYVDDMGPQQWSEIIWKEFQTIPDSTLVVMAVHPARFSPKGLRASELANLVTNEIHRRDVEQYGAVELYSTYYKQSRTCQHMEMLDALHFPFGVNKFPGHKGLYPDGLPLSYPTTGNPHRRVWFWGCWFEYVNGEWVEVEHGTQFLTMFAHLLK